MTSAGLSAGTGRVSSTVSPAPPATDQLVARLGSGIGDPDIERVGNTDAQLSGLIIEALQQLDATRAASDKRNWKKPPMERYALKEEAQ